MTSLSERRASGWTGSGTQRRELHRNLVVLELAQDWKRTEERSKERKEEDKRKTGAFLKNVREDDEPVLVLVPHIKNRIVGAVDVHVSHIAKDGVEAVRVANLAQELSRSKLNYCGSVRPRVSQVSF